MGGISLTGLRPVRRAPEHSRDASCWEKCTKRAEGKSLGGHGQQGHGCGVGGIAVQPGAGAEEAGVRREEKAGFLQEEGVET